MVHRHIYGKRTSERQKERQLVSIAEMGGNSDRLKHCIRHGSQLQIGQNFNFILKIILAVKIEKMNNYWLKNNY